MNQLIKLKNFFEYRVIKTIRNGKLTLYKYSDNQSIEEKEHSIYHYQFDRLNEEERAHAKIILFTGQTGHGKSTAINAFFNIMKGVKFEDEYRFILIEEKEKKEGQAVSQTKGIHLYYLKDVYKEPFIIIDSQGFLDTDNKVETDDKTSKIFEYLFQNTINHINSICFIHRGIDARLDIKVIYGINRVMSLFADDVKNSFFILNSFANRDAMEENPLFIRSVIKNKYFPNLIENRKGNWWYSFDSIEILTNIYPDSINLYSWEQYNKFYHETIKNCYPISIKKSSEVLINKNMIKVKSNTLKNKFQDLSLRQKNLNALKISNENQINKIKEIDNQIEKYQIDFKNKSFEEQKRNIMEILKLDDERIADLNNQVITKTDYILSSYDKKCTFCKTCKKNCHDPCNCWLTWCNRCCIFDIIGCWGVFDKENHCEKCKCGKSSHEIAQKYHYTPETKCIPVDNTEKIKQIKKDKEKKKEMASNSINNISFDSSDDNFKILENKKIKLEIEKNEFEEKKKTYEIEMKEIKKEILAVIVELKKISVVLENNALDKSYIKNENDYIDSLTSQLDNIGDNKQEQILKLKELKLLNEQFMRYKNYNIEDLERMTIEELVKDIDDFFNHQNNN